MTIMESLGSMAGLRCSCDEEAAIDPNKSLDRFPSGGQE